jgi:hypothetical protein
LLLSFPPFSVLSILFSTASISFLVIVKNI